MIKVSDGRIQELEHYIREGLVQAKERGCNPVDVDEISTHFEDLKKKSAANRWQHYEIILDMLSNLVLQEEFPYEEPSTFDGIISNAAKSLGMPSAKLSDSELKNRIHGAWLGRCAGCMLGKPVEGRNREYIRKLLEAANEYPLNSYFPEVKKLPKGCEDYKPDSRLIKGNITCTVRDDDTDYPVANMYIVKRYGLDFTSASVAQGWLERFPYDMVCTAERIAYRNFINGIMPPESASYRNPYCEWIGAQIRADFWAWISPGEPKHAAELAFRDASISHLANGIYGEMFFAAAIASAFATDDMDMIIKSALSVVPVRSRFTEMVHDVFEIFKKNKTWESAIEEFMAKYGKYHVIHTINNAGIVILGLLYGGGDFGKTISFSVMGGEDTDCNGATAGSLMGAMIGAKRFPREWSDCLNDTLESAVIGYDKSKISDLADQTYEIAKQNIQHIKERKNG
jgi:ADP-ribosylglycohydrolase